MSALTSQCAQTYSDEIVFSDFCEMCIDRVIPGTGLDTGKAEQHVSTPHPCRIV